MKNSKPIVNCFVVGSAKSMTTSFCEVLNLFDEVYKPRVKEPGFFVKHKNDGTYIPSEVNRKGLNWYHALFNESAKFKVVYDATQVHSQYPLFQSAPLIHEYNKDAKIIWLFRKISG